MNFRRRSLFGFGAAAASAAVLGSRSAAQAAPADPATAEAAVDENAIPTSAADARDWLSLAYQVNTRLAGGTWSSYISVTEPDGTVRPAVEDRADEVVQAYSVNKIAVAAAVLDKVDRGLLTLDQRVDVTADIVIQDGDGIFRLDGGYPSSVTIGHALSALLLVSDDTAVRLCGLVCPAAELNEILRAKGFTHTKVVPVANPNRFFLGATTPRETHTLLQKLVTGTLLSEKSTAYLLNTLRWKDGFNDGIRRKLTTQERLRVATKAGWLKDGRNEAGVVFNEAGRAMLTYALFASGTFNGPYGEPENFAANHPALEARANLGRFFVNGVSKISANAPALRVSAAYQPRNGG